MKMRLPWLWPVIIFLSALAACIVTYVIPHAQIRAVIVMSFLFICPGMALVRFLRLNDIVTEWILAFSLSFALDAIVGGVFLYTGHWSLSGILITVLAISLIGATGQLLILHPAVAQRLNSLSIFKIPEDSADSATIALPRVSPSSSMTKVDIEDQQTAYLPSYKVPLSTDQNKDVAEINTVQMPAVTGSKPTQEAIADHDTMHMNALEHLNANDSSAKSDEPQNSFEAIEDKDTAHISSTPYSRLPQPKPASVPDKQALEEKDTLRQPVAINEADEEKSIADSETAYLPGVTPIPETQSDETAVDSEVNPLLEFSPTPSVETPEPIPSVQPRKTLRKKRLMKEETTSDSETQNDI